MDVTDLDTVIRGWVKNLPTFRSENIVPQDNDIEIDWSKVRISTVKTEFPPDQPPSTKTPSASAHTPSSTAQTLSAPPQTPSTSAQMPSAQTPAPQTVSSGGSHVVFKSNYVNRTSEVQNHTFQMERSTDATVTTSVNKGFSKNGLVGIKIGVPDEVENLTGSFGSDIVIETEDKNVVKHQVSWGLNSTVRAQPNKRTVAELKITVAEHSCNFKSEVIMRGRVLVRVHNGDITQFHQNALATILKDEKAKNRFTPPAAGMTIEDQKVIWTVSGKLTFKFGVSQDVKVWTEDI